MGVGLLRFLLATSVILTHSSPILGNILVGGGIAVEAFFIISGFYMALILNEKYVGKGSYKLFITNRYLRLFPVYAIILMVSVMLYWYWYTAGLPAPFQPIGMFVQYWPILNPMSILFLISTNLMMFGQDIVMLLGLNTSTGGLFFSPASRSEPALFHFLFVPQCWSIGIELSFYLIAPFIVRRKLPVIVLLFLISGYFYYYNQYITRTFYTECFPTEFVLFMGGVLGYKIYKYLEEYKLNGSLRLFDNKNLYYSLIIFLIGLCIAFRPIFAYGRLIHFIPEFHVFLFVIIGLSLPVLFLFSKDNPLDRYIGELSYPMYICHYIIVQIYILTIVNLLDPSVYGVVCVISAVIVAMILNKYIQDPVDRYRKRRVESQKRDSARISSVK